MTLILVGLNHHTAPVELREQFYLTDDHLRQTLDALTAETSGALAECAIVSTCNRLEIYGETNDAIGAIHMVTAYLSRLHDLAPSVLTSHLYHMTDADVITHLSRVAAGLDSLILGEPQILGQVADALAHAQLAGTAGPILSRVFASAVHAGKRARAETDISRYTMSVSHAAALLVRQTLGDLSQAQALVVGAGEMAEIAARALQSHGVRKIQLISRTHVHAIALANRLNGVDSGTVAVGATHGSPRIPPSPRLRGRGGQGGEGPPFRAIDWNLLPDTLADADVVIAATGAPHTVIHAADVSPALSQRADRPILIVDVAVPRDIDEAVGALPGVRLYDIDDLNLVIDIHRAQREAAVFAVEAIVRAEAAECLRWLQSRDVVPVITELRRKADALADAEVEQALRRLNGLSERDQAIVAQMAHRIVNKLLHDPTTALKLYAGSEAGHDYARIVRDLFALDDLPVPVESDAVTWDAGS